ncbi:DUF2812 domain-containing protein [Lysinibacillus sp. NPDC097287]|uniref:DUF2812 domain-containing protein n=1 Tax=Lysinibacillus sp. NPDC097287 TaxID=3364144 RepID=UPI003819B358
MKKLRVFWSYQLDKTEEWLTDMASQGYHLCDFNAVTRMFTFDKRESKATSYAIRLEKQALPSALQQAGWQVAATSKNWQFVKNESEGVTIYPSREAIVKRTRMHAYIFILLMIFFLSGQFGFFFLGIIMTNMFDVTNIGLIMIPFTIIMIFASLTIYVYRAYRKFEKREMDMTIHDIGKGRKVRKIKVGWMYLPLQTKEWLEEQARLGLELEHVSVAIFTFRETGKKSIAYEVSFEPKVNSSFFTIHKEMGWQLKYASNMTLLHNSIWAMPYEEEEKAPALASNVEDKIRSMKKAFYMNIGIFIYILLMSGYSLYTNIFLMKVSFFEWSFNSVLSGFVLAVTTLWIVLFSRTITGFVKEMKMVKADL